MTTPESAPEPERVKAGGLHDPQDEKWIEIGFSGIQSWTRQAGRYGLDPDARHAVLHVAGGTTTASDRDLNDHLVRCGSARRERRAMP